MKCFTAYKPLALVSVTTATLVSLNLVMISPAAAVQFQKVLKAKHNKQPRVINVDKNAAYSPGIEELKSNKILEKK